MDKVIRRESNFELLRIICMLFVVWGHFINKYTGGEFIVDFAFIETRFIKSFTIVAVNVFVLISGYFSISFKLLKILKIGELVLFYSVVQFILAVVLGWHEITPTKDIAYLVPILSRQYWFITVYIMLCLLSPILNKLSISISKNDFKVILVIGFFLIYVWQTISYIFNFSGLYFDAGYGIVNFVYLYLLGRYMKIHYSLIDWKWRFLIGYIVVCVLLFIFQLSFSLILGFSFTSLFSYNTVFVFLGGVLLFLFFVKVKLGYNRHINVLAKNCFAVYIIHQHPLCWNKICELLQIQEISPLWFLPYSFIMSVFLYFALAAIEKIRLFFFDKLENRLNERIMSIKRVKNIENMIKLVRE